MVEQPEDIEHEASDTPDDGKSKESRFRIPRGSGLATGLALGTALGIAMDDLALWIAIGLALGVSMDSTLGGDAGEDDDSNP